MVFKNDCLPGGLKRHIPYATGPRGAGHFIGDFVCSLAAGGKGKGVVMNGHEKNPPMS
jgi:hypothetical protein